jgi:hypothetical protein
MDDFSYTGRLLVILGAVLAALGIVLIFAERGTIPRLPGDISARFGNVRVWIPLGWSILLSVVFSIVLTLLARRR